jgi:hypothetical protein
MEKFTHACLKCQTRYEDTDPEPYYCESCKVERKAIAAEIDKKLATRVSKRQQKSDLQIFNEISKARGSRFVNIKDLGISL